MVGDSKGFGVVGSEGREAGLGMSTTTGVTFTLFSTGGGEARRLVGSASSGDGGDSGRGTSGEGMASVVESNWRALYDGLNVEV